MVRTALTIALAASIWITPASAQQTLAETPEARLSIDWSLGDVQSTRESCGYFAFSSMQEGNAYSLAIMGQEAATCSFEHEGLTFHMPVGHGATTANTYTVYTFLRTGTHVFVAWAPGY